MSMSMSELFCVHGPATAPWCELEIYCEVQLQRGREVTLFQLGRSPVWPRLRIYCYHVPPI